MAWRSTLPDVIDTLITVLSADPQLSGIVHDGAELRHTAGHEVVFVGYTGTDDETVAEGSFTRNGLAVVPDRENYAIRCAVVALDGASDVPATRRRCYTLFAAAGAALAADKTLGGLVLSASPGEWAFSLAQTDSGAVGTLAFDVAVDAYTQL